MKTRRSRQKRNTVKNGNDEKRKGKERSFVISPYCAPYCSSYHSFYHTLQSIIFSFKFIHRIIAELLVINRPKKNKKTINLFDPDFYPALYIELVSYINKYKHGINMVAVVMIRYN